MIFALIGKDSYRRHERTREIFSAYAEKHGRSSLETFDLADEGALLSFFEFCGTRGLFSPFRMAVLKSLEEVEKSANLKKILKALQAEKDIIVLISEDAITKDFAFLKQKPNKVEIFECLPREEFIEFLKKEIKTRGVSIETGAVLFLADVFKGNSMGAVNELAKLSFLKGAPISADFLRKEEGLKLPHDFFSLLRGLLGASLPAKLKNLETLLSFNEDPAKIFNVLAYLNMRDIKKFADYDVLIKSGKIGYEEALLEMVLS